MSQHPYRSALQEAEKLLDQNYQASKGHYDGLIGLLDRVKPEEERLTAAQMDEVSTMVQKLKAKMAADLRPIILGTGPVNL